MSKLELEKELRNESSLPSQLGRTSEAERLALITARQVDLVLAEVRALELAIFEEQDECRAFAVDRAHQRRPVGFHTAQIIPFKR